MIGGVIYLGMVAWSLIGKFNYRQPTDAIFVLVVSLIAFGLGYLVFKTGLAMLCSVNAATISTFSFLFALIFTLVLVRVLPVLDFLHRHPVLTILFTIIYFGLTYMILKRILLSLLFPKMKDPATSA